MLITFNNSTTTLEALSQGTPVISLQTESWALEDDIAQSDAIVSVSPLSDCESSIKKILNEQMDSIKEAGTFKTERVIETPQETEINVLGKSVINFCANKKFTYIF